MSGWEAKAIGEVCTIKPSKAEARAKLADSDEVSFAPMEDLGIGEKYLQPRRTRRLGEVSGSYTYFADGDVLLAKITPCFENGKLGVARGLTNGIGFGSSEYIVLRPGAALDAQFLYYYLSQPAFKEEGARSMTGAVGHKRVTKEFVEGSSIPLPPLPEQRRLVAIIDEAFEAIAAAKANSEKNLQNAREVFEQSIAAMLRERGDDWNASTIGEVCTLKSGTTVPIDVERPSGDIPYVKVAEMTMPENTDGITTSIRFIDRSDLKPAWVIPAGAVIFPKRGGAILTNKKRLVLVDICADLNIMSVIPSDLIMPEFLYLFFLTVDMRKLGTGSSIPQINNYDIAPLSISFPSSKKLQQALTSRLALIKAECESLASLHARKLDALDELKKSLLHRAFTGQLTAKATDQQLAVVA